MMDIQKFQNELMNEIKEKFPDYFGEENSLPSQILNAMSFVAVLALEKYERENLR